MQKSRKSRARKQPAQPLNGDLGTQTPLAVANTAVEAVQGPNDLFRRRRLNAIDSLTLTMRQGQAANAIQEAWCKLEMQSSGSELKETVDTSSRPDAVIGVQIDAQSRWLHVNKAIPNVDREIVEHVCCHNLPIKGLIKKYNLPNATKRFKSAMDAVADHLKF